MNRIRAINCCCDKIVNNGIFVVFPVIGSDDVNIAALIDLGATNEGASRRQRIIGRSLLVRELFWRQHDADFAPGPLY